MKISSIEVLILLNPSQFVITTKDGNATVYKPLITQEGVLINLLSPDQGLCSNTRG